MRMSRSCEALYGNGNKEDSRWSENLGLFRVPALYEDMEDNETCRREFKVMLVSLWMLGVLGQEVPLGFLWILLEVNKSGDNAFIWLLLLCLGTSGEDGCDAMQVPSAYSHLCGVKLYSVWDFKDLAMRSHVGMALKDFKILKLIWNNKLITV